MPTTRKRPNKNRALLEKLRDDAVKRFGTFAAELKEAEVGGMNWKRLYDCMHKELYLARTIAKDMLAIETQTERKLPVYIVNKSALKSDGGED